MTIERAGKDAAPGDAAAPNQETVAGGPGDGAAASSDGGLGGAEAEPVAPVAARGPFQGGAPRLWLLSTLLLFVELALIRWTAANNVHVGTIPNFVLLASFLGIGLGFLLAGSRFDLLRPAPVVLGVLVAFCLVFPAQLKSLRGPNPFTGFAGLPALPQQVSLPIVFALSAIVLAGIGQGMARVFSTFRPLDAYRIDILGSICGIVLFSLLSLLGLPPAIWGVLAAAGLLAVIIRKSWWHYLAAAAIVAMLIAESLSPNDTWSPYYKITTVHHQATNSLSVWGNGIPYQTLYPLPLLHRLEPFYFFPYRHVSKAHLSQVLVIGAGTGNDVGVALSQGARHIDAVEIDPKLVNLGRRYNPEHAYQSPRVTVHVDDGRAFLENSSRKYTLIIYALPDSLTALGGQSAPVGLENYLLTENALESARQHLASGGTFVMYNYYQPFLLARYATTVTQVFGHRPCVELGDSLSGRQQAVLTVNRSSPATNCATYWHGRAVAPVTDDRPFPYLPTPSIPGIYLWIIGLVFAASLISVRVVAGPLKAVGRYFDLFWMGAAFLLLESKSVVQFALLFGTTWYVNSLVFGGVLVSVYLAVELARHVRLPRPLILYAALVVTLAVAWIVPNSSLLALPAVPRFLAATAMAFAPIFLANLVFAQRFADVAASTTAFGANLLGAIAGGLLEYISLITGFRFLLIVVAVLYGLAMVFGRRHLGAATAES